MDLGKAERDDHHNIVQQIIVAAHEFGFFQVINHGVSTRLVDDTQSVFKEFFELPAEEKSRFLSADFSRKFALSTSNVDYVKEEIHNWRDSLRHICFPSEETIQCSPQYLPDTEHRAVTNKNESRITAAFFVCQLKTAL